MMDGLRPGELPQDTITAALARAVADVPDKVFLDFSGDTYTFAEVDRLSTELAHGLLELGVATGQPVATMFSNTIDAVTVWLAINKIGAVSAPVNTSFKGTFLRNQLNDCTAEVVLAEDGFAPLIADIAGELPHMRRFVTHSPASVALPGVDVLELESLRKAGLPAIADEVTPGQLAMLVYTSGTTGASKGCMLCHNHACNIGWGAALGQGYRPDDILWSALPLFHLNAIAVSVVTAMIARLTVAIAPRFSVSGFWPDIERSGATVVSLLGSMATLIAEAPDTEVSKRCYGQVRKVGAAPFPPDMVQKWRDRFGVPAEGSGGYGMTEAATISSLGPGE